MPRPASVRTVDTMLGIPRADMARNYDFMRAHFRDAASRGSFAFPAEYMFKEVPKFGAEPTDFVALVLGLMDRHGIDVALTGYDPSQPDTERALREHPSRFVAETYVDPNRGMDEVRRVRALVRSHDLRAVSGFGAGAVPQVPLGDKRWYPLYAACCELGLPVFTCLGIPGPRVPAAPQHVRELDDVLADFPELVLVLRHGGEPWVDELVLRMSDHPNLHYSTTAFAPRYYPPQVLEYARGHGRAQVLYGGYFPAGLSLDRIARELDELPLDAETFTAFLSTNARRILRLPDASDASAARADESVE